jgi:hypothetical protein
MLPPLNDTRNFPKWLLKVQAILHAKRWNGITTQKNESLAFYSFLSELYMLLINCLDGDMREPYIQGGPSSCANQGILVLHNLISTHQSLSRAGLVSLFTRFLQAHVLPTETLIQYCSKICGLSTRLGRLGQPISEPLLHILVIHGLTPNFADFASQVFTGIIDVVHGFNSWDAFICSLCDYVMHLNTRPAPSTARSTDLDPSDLVLVLVQTHHSKDHTKDCCGTVKRLFAVS